MQQDIREFIEIAAETLPWTGPVVEFGSFQVPGQESIADIRGLFAGTDFVGADVRPGPGVDRVLDLHAIDLPDDSVGTVVLLETLEHVRKPWLAMREVHRVLRPGGFALISVPLQFPIHNHPDDFWRFTDAGLAVLLEDFESVMIDALGQDDFPAGYIAVASKGPMPDTVAYRAAMEPRLGWWRAISERIRAVEKQAVTATLNANSPRVDRGPSA